MACIDGSASSPAVCDAAAWASSRLSAPLTFLHVLDHRHYPVTGDLSGAIGLGSREYLLEQLAALDEQRNRLALEEGRLMLACARERAQAAGIAWPETRQRHGGLADTLQELEADTRLFVIGQRGEGSAAGQVGSQLESVVRLVHRPVLVTPTDFAPPRNLMLAFDGSPTARKAVETLAASPLLQELPMHLVMIGADRQGPRRSSPGPADAGAGRLRRAHRPARRRGRTGAACLSARARHRPAGHGRLRSLADSAVPGGQHHDAHASHQLDAAAAVALSKAVAGRACSYRRRHARCHGGHRVTRRRAFPFSLREKMARRAG